MLVAEQVEHALHRAERLERHLWRMLDCGALRLLAALASVGFNISDNRLATSLDIHVFDRDLLLALAAVLVESPDLLHVD